jgi:hypothetical protein
MGQNRWIKWGMNQSKKISPTIIVRLTPITNMIFRSSITVMGIFNVVDFGLHRYYPESFRQWLRFSEPVTSFMSQVIWAVGQISRDMHEFRIDQRIDILTNIISIDWLIYLVGISAMMLSLFFEFYTNGSEISFRIRTETRGLSWNRIMILYIAFSLLFLLIIYTGIGYYYPVALYRNDVSFLFSTVYFYYALSLHAALLAFCLMHFFPETAVTTASRQS